MLLCSFLLAVAVPESACVPGPRPGVQGLVDRSSRPRHLLRPHGFVWNGGVDGGGRARLRIVLLLLLLRNIREEGAFEACFPWSPGPVP